MCNLARRPIARTSCVALAAIAMLAGSVQASWGAERPAPAAISPIAISPAATPIGSRGTEDATATVGPNLDGVPPAAAAPATIALPSHDPSLYHRAAVGHYRGELQIRAEDAETIAHNLRTFADLIGDASDARSLIKTRQIDPALRPLAIRLKAFLRSQDGAAASRSFNAERLSRIYDLIEALHADAKEQLLSRASDDTRRAKWATLRSHTVETLVQLAHDIYVSPEGFARLALEGSVSRGFARTAVGTSFGGADLAAYLGQMAGGAHWNDPEVMIKLLDGVQKTAWGIVGMAITPGDLETKMKAGQAFANAAGHAAEFGRAHTVDFMLDAGLAWQRLQNQGPEKGLIAEYTTAQAALKARGRSADLVSIEVFYGKDREILRLIPPAQRAEVNARFGVRAPVSLDRPDRPARPERPVRPAETATVVSSTRTVRDSYHEVCNAGYCVRHSLQVPSGIDGVVIRRPLTFHIVDYGVNGDWRAGTPLVKVPSQAEQNAQDPLFAHPVRPVTPLVITMPSDTELGSMTVAQLRANIADQLRGKVGEALRNRSSEFEIRLLQHMTLAGYFNRQDIAAKFGQIAYGALADVIDSLQQRGADVSLFGTFGSNGTVLFSKSFEAWRSIAAGFQRVTFVDGRAKADDVVRMLRARSGEAPLLPAERLRIIDTRRDALAPPDSIANLLGAWTVQQEFHRVQLLLLEPNEPFSRVFQHIASLIDGKARFKAVQYFSNGEKRTLKEVTRAQLYPQFDAASARAFAGPLPVVGMDRPQVPQLRAVHAPDRAVGDSKVGGVLIDPVPVLAGRLPGDLRARVLGACGGATTPACSVP